MSHSRPNAKRLRAAWGYIELGMFEAANDEVGAIEAVWRGSPDVQRARLEIYRGLEKWELMEIVAVKLLEWNPKKAGHFVNLAYAARRAQSVGKAREILARAAELHPDDATIQFNLACYDAQLGDIDAAKEHLKRATSTEAKFSAMALDDPDLAPLWDSLGGRNV